MCQDGASPLFVASQEGHTDIVRELLKANAPVDQQTKVNMYRVIQF